MLAEASKVDPTESHSDELNDDQRIEVSDCLALVLSLKLTSVHYSSTSCSPSSLCPSASRSWSPSSPTMLRRLTSSPSRELTDSSYIDTAHPLQTTELKKPR